MLKGRPEIDLKGLVRSREVPEGSYAHGLLKQREDLTRDWIEYHFGVRYFGKFRQGLELLRSGEEETGDFTSEQLIIIQKILEDVEKQDKHRLSMMYPDTTQDDEEAMRRAWRSSQRSGWN